MKRVVLIICVLCCGMSLTGCNSKLTLDQYSQNIAKMQLVQTIGVDRAENCVEVTAAAKTEDSGQGESAMPVVLSARSASVAGGLEGLIELSPKESVFLAHTRHYALGEQTAVTGVSEYLDFIGRDMNMRLNTSVYIVRGASAKELMTATCESGGDISQMLENIQQGVRVLTGGYVFSCGEVTANLAESGCALVAAIELVDAGDSIIGEGSVAPRSAGYAVIKEGKLVEYIDREDAAGVNIFLSGTNPDITQIQTADGGLVALHVAVDKSQFTPVFEYGEIAGINARVVLNASIDEVAGETDIFSEQVLADLSEQISAQITEQGEKTIDMSQRLQADFLKIGKKINVQNPVEFAQMENSWEDVFSRVKINLTVETRIERTYDLMQPIGVSGGEE